MPTDPIAIGCTARRSTETLRSASGTELAIVRTAYAMSRSASQRQRTGGAGSRPRGGKGSRGARRGGRSPGPEPLDRELRLVAEGDIPILILGETGAGKEVLAERIHATSSRRDGPFVRVQCAALTVPLLERTLFGGAASAPEQRRIRGCMHAARGGTLFFDEVGELTREAQAALLRVLEQREAFGRGRSRPPAFDVRFLAASQHDLRRAVTAGTFRADLYHRLAGYSVTVPALRERPQAIAAFATEFAAETARARGGQPPSIPLDSLALLQGYAWPGNVRELRNVIEGAVLLARDGVLRPAHLPPRLQHLTPADEENAAKPEPRGRLRGELARIERERILEALEGCAGNQTRAAKLLGMSRRTLVKRITEYDLPRPRLQPSVRLRVIANVGERAQWKR